MAEPGAKRARVDDDEALDPGRGGDGAEVCDDPDMYSDLLPDASISPKLVAIKQELDKLNEEASDKVLEIEQTYSRLRRPVYARRSELLCTIPGFWAAAIGHHPEFRGVLTAEDEDILSYCTDVRVEDYEDIKSGYRIAFRFSKDNPYFEEEELVKSFTYQQGGSLLITCTKPTWAQGCEPLSSSDDDPESQVGVVYHFFRWFMDEQQEIDGNDDIAELIKEDIWADPTRYWAHTGPYSDVDDGEGEVLEGEVEQFSGEEYALDEGEEPEDLDAADGEFEDGGLEAEDEGAGEGEGEDVT